MNDRYTAPVPEVHYLPSLFRKIQSGELRIPAFQRGFVWKQKNIIELMESIFLGYPIGSLLFWRSPAGQLKEIPADLTSFPVATSRTGDVLYVLDGMQRMSTLYGVFHKESSKDTKFRIAYDFLEKRFYAPNDEDGEIRDGSIALESLFNPREFLAFQSRALLRPQGDGDALIEKSIELQSIFQEYLVPTVTINDRGIPDVVEIFSRVNSTGVKLDIVDFVRALTWSSQFDLTQEVQSLISLARSKGYDIEGQTFVKLVSICAELETTSESMYKMREMDAVSLHSAVLKAKQLVPLALDKLAQENRIINSNLLGYEGQFLIWAAALKTTNCDLNFDYSSIRQLVWQIGFGEILRGKPDHFLERILQKIYSRLWSNFVAEFKVTDQLLITRRYLSGKALTSSVISLFYDRQEKLKDEGEISFEFDGRLFPALKIDRRFGETRSDKVFANLVVGFDILPADSNFSDVLQLFTYMNDNLGKKPFSDWLKINFIDEKNLPKNVEEFLIQRASEMRVYANSLIGII